MCQLRPVVKHKHRRATNQTAINLTPCHAMLGRKDCKPDTGRSQPARRRRFSGDAALSSSTWPCLPPLLHTCTLPLLGPGPAPPPLLPPPGPAALLPPPVCASITRTHGQVGGFGLPGSLRSGGCAPRCSTFVPLDQLLRYENCTLLHLFGHVAAVALVPRSAVSMLQDKKMAALVGGGLLVPACPSHV